MQRQRDFIVRLLEVRARRAKKKKRFATAANSTACAVKSLSNHCWSRLCDCTFPSAKGGHTSIHADHTQLRLCNSNSE